MFQEQHRVLITRSLGKATGVLSPHPPCSGSALQIKPKMPPGFLRCAASAYANRSVGEGALTAPAPPIGSSGASAGGTRQGSPPQAEGRSNRAGGTDGWTDGWRMSWDSSTCTGCVDTGSSSTAGRLQGFPSSCLRLRLRCQSATAQSQTSRFRLSWAFHQIVKTSRVHMKKR